ncbi:MAG TPA: hypothetical protein GXX33_09845 [Firmicutes bacterium]|uniref:Uncharacterized protein n=1 Tax=Capillibacterium thermochitinicola TaxID=2699427 RepID=A0A8J6HYM5_9FIRM|nr:hypothetical protein [Capillibacterium thermochitinicola]MBA2132073.1 hypothetical protein [Capillibacterium thermochitinicola]HHW13287.1 hypothetical protein [Bacillota bacterium]
MSRKNWSLRQIFIIALVGLLTSGLLFGGGFLYEKFFQRNPLQKWVKTNPAITGFQLQEQKAGLCLELTLDPQKVDNLQAILEPFIREVVSRKQRPVHEVRIANEPSPELAEVYYQLSFALAEAQATGEYNTLYGVLQSLQAAAGEADFRVYLGTDYLYVQLKKGNESYFSVVPRNDYANLVLAMETKGGRG